ncbi:MULTISPECIES: helix-turn-helix domain-containing protein [unclassified Microbacterium]|uniref:helix-turn-helix domain-containing protein n=1 Tax=unclassified Microbacterium TaxID=2609290 RepID=UPI00214B2C05|nr:MULTISPECIES: helix-turn-helix domain-containing protein [unclassified Microbacterium]MCR2784071.1 helix-turn-helix domain-containing protein [Microbacterium sp. zg.B96]MDL5351011.1 helix-turn-helix domain-containing protein [Microbacterium sp. zg-YB36]WIM15089.1 helix-turn-helix domain-containing protein [Microbacterium sp. zg-B96]
MTYLPDEPVIILTASDARILWQAARLNELRLKHRTGGNNRLYSLLVNVYRVGLAVSPDAAPGNETRQEAASEEREYWTTQQLAKATGQAERTIRLHIQDKTIPATKPGKSWLIHKDDATTYIASGRKH